jgi:Ankyrin repeats (3 copies)/Ankyrin repeat
VEISKPPVSRLAIVAALAPVVVSVLYIKVFVLNPGPWLLSVFSLLLGIFAKRRIKKRSEILRGLAVAKIGVILSWIVLVVATIGTFVDFTSTVQKSSVDVWAKHFTKAVEFAQERYYMNQETAPRYTSDLTELLPIDMNLAEFPSVTFEFFYANQTGFMLSAQHAKDIGGPVHYAQLGPAGMNEPLDIAAARGETEKIARLIESGAKIDAPGVYGRTPLHYAAHHGRTKAAEMLLDAGADINAQNFYKRTPLHLAAWNDKIETAKLLVRHGADLDAKDDHLRTPRDLAVWNNHKTLAGYLRKNENFWSTFAEKNIRKCWREQKPILIRAADCFR